MPHTNSKSRFISFDFHGPEFSKHELKGYWSCPQIPHSTEFSGGVRHRSSKASRGEDFDIRVNLDLWYTRPPTNGGPRHGHVTVHRSPEAPDGGPGFDQSHRGRVSARGSTL